MAREVPPRGVPARGWHELVVEGRVDELTLAPDGSIWLATTMGEIYSGDSIRADWRTVLRRDTTGDEFFSGQAFSRVTFFDADTAIVTGMIGADSLSTGGNAYLRTTNGGASWDTLRLPDEQWIYQVFVLGHQAWMGGSSGSFLHTRDAGKSWRLVSHPFDSSSRLERIFMEDEQSGIIGALGNAIRVTRDGGRSWRPVATPLDQHPRPRPRGEDHDDHRIQGLAYFGGGILAAQEGKVYFSPRERIAWREVPGGMVRFAVDPDGRVGYGVDSAQNVLRFGRELKPARVSPRPIQAPVQDIAVRAGSAYLLDDQGAIHRIGANQSSSGFPWTRRPARLPFAHLRRQGGVLWASTTNHLYRSRDGRAWDLVGSVPFSIAGMAPQSRASVLLWDGHGSNARMDTRTGAVVAVDSLAGWDIVEVVTMPDRWLAYGGRQYETAERIEVAQTFFGGQFRGSRANGFVLASRDRGVTWRLLDEWANTGVSSLFAHEDGSLTLFSYLGGVRRVPAAGPGAETLLAATGRRGEAVPYVQTVGALYFEDANHGWVDGWIHHLGDRRFTTRDGGRSWRQVPTRDHHFVQMARLPQGWVASTGDAVYLLSGGSERKLFDLRGGAGSTGQGAGDQEYRRPGIQEISSDDEGNVVIYLAGGRVMVIPTDSAMRPTPR